MKKISVIILSALLILSAMFSFAACSGEDQAKIGVQSGTTGFSFMNGDADWGFEGFSNCKVSAYDTGALAVQDMKAGNIDYVVIDADPAKEFVAADNSIKVIDIPLTTESYGVAVDKNQPELLASINTVLKNNKDKIDAIFKSYEAVDDSNAANWEGATIPKGTYDESKNQLVVATNAAFAPFEFTVGDSFAGIDMEIAKLIADELGMELVIVNMEFDAITGALGKNGIDAGLAAMTINAARSKVVSFSDAYYTDAYQVVICKADDTTFDSCKTTEDMIAKLKEIKG